MTVKIGTAWQLILADLALILFLLTLSALPDQGGVEEGSLSSLGRNEIAPAQSLFIDTGNGRDFEQWAALATHDPRATLTIVANHSDEGRELVWSRAQQLAGVAEQSGFSVRVILRPASQDLVYASLAYDTVAPEYADEMSRIR